MPQIHQMGGTTEQKITSAGAPVAAKMNIPSQDDIEAAAAGQAPVNNNQNGGDDPPSNTPANTTTVVTEDQVKEYLKSQGIEFDGTLDDMKQKLSKQDIKPEPTEEEKEKAIKALDKRMLDEFINTGGTPEQYVALKTVATMDAKELSKESTIKELREAGFDEKKIDSIIKERYYQIDIESIKKEEDESDEDFKARKEELEKKMAYGTKKLESKSLHLKTDAETILNNLKQSISAKDAQKQREQEFLSKVDETLSKLPRKIKIELGELNEEKIEPIAFDVTDADIEAVKNILKDPAQRKKYFLNQETVIGLDDAGLANLADLVVKNELSNTMLKKAYLEGGSRQVTLLKTVFPDSPHLVGVGGAPQKGGSGKIAKAGQPVRVPQHN